MFKRIGFFGLAFAAMTMVLLCGCKSRALEWDADNDNGDIRQVPRAMDDPTAAAPLEAPTEVPQAAGGSNWTANPNELAAAGADKDGWTLADPSGNRLNMPIVYFAYDSDVLVNSEMKKIRAIADYLNRTPELVLVLEGHCDQRGTEEYNRALGERRANAVRAALEENGVAGNRMRTQSFGEDKPAVQGNDAAAWRQNRRCVPVPMLLPRN